MWASKGRSDQKDLFTILTLSGRNTDLVTHPSGQKTELSSIILYRTFDNFCRHNGKWLEIPYIQAFFALRSRPTLDPLWTPSVNSVLLLKYS